MLRFLAELFVAGFSIQFEKIMDCLKDIVFNFKKEKEINVY